MTQSMFATLIILVAMLIIISSLGFGLYYLLSDQQNGKRIYKSLTLRVSLSLFLILCIGLAIYFGWITPNSPPL